MYIFLNWFWIWDLYSYNPIKIQLKQMYQIKLSSAAWTAKAFQVVVNKERDTTLWTFILNCSNLRILSNFKNEVDLFFLFKMSQKWAAL